MSEFNVNDRVYVHRPTVNESPSWAPGMNIFDDGKWHTITMAGGPWYQLDDNGTWSFSSKWLTKYDKVGEEQKAKGETMSSSERFYRVKKDLPAWAAGAIVKRSGDGDYEAISDLWETFEEGYPHEYVEKKEIVENSPEFFERVYSIGVLGKAKFVVKEMARKMHNQDYKEGK